MFGRRGGGGMAMTSALLETRANHQNENVFVCLTIVLTKGRDLDGPEMEKRLTGKEVGR